MIKKKIINDPVYGFITVPSDLISEIISPPLLSAASAHQTV
jgi:HD superfamily phosphohydrolase